MMRKPTTERRGFSKAPRKNVVNEKKKNKPRDTSSERSRDFRTGIPVL